MKITVFNQTLVLLQRKTATGHAGSAIIAEKSVRACVRLPSVSFAVKAEAAGRTVDMIATIRRNDFNAAKWTHAEFDGICYRIESANSAEKDMFVRLALRRT